MQLRERRRQLGWSFARTAKAARIASPAYVFHIENGHKTPSERVAGRLAQALGMDPGLLRAWSRARNPRDLAAAFEATATLTRLLGLSLGTTPDSETPAMEPGTPNAPGTEAAGTHTAAALPYGADWIEVPLLAEGTGPDERPPLDTLRLERRLFPPLPAGACAVAYRLTAHGVRRVPGLLFAGDFAVVLVGGGEPSLDAPCAVRIDGRVELARVRVRDDAVYLPAAGRSHDAGDDSGERVPGRAAEVLVGPVVVAFRRWL